MHLQRMLCVTPAGMLSVQASAEMLGCISAGIATRICWLGPYKNDVGQDIQLVLALQGWKYIAHHDAVSLDEACHFPQECFAMT